MPPRKIQPSADLAADAQDAVCAPDPVAVGTVGATVGGVGGGAMIAVVLGTGVEVGTTAGPGCAAGSAAIVLSVGFVLIVAIYVQTAILYGVYTPELFPTEIRLRAFSLS